MGRATLPLSEGFGALGRWVVGPSLRVLNYLVAIGPRGWRAEAAPKQGQAAFLFAGDLAGGGRARGPPPPRSSPVSTCLVLEYQLPCPISRLCSHVAE